LNRKPLKLASFKPFPAENKWIIFEFPTKLTPIGETAKTSVTKTATEMLYSPIKNLEVKGINHFAKRNSQVA
jgi:hypothetical protein